MIATRHPHRWLLVSLLVLSLLLTACERQLRDDETAGQPTPTGAVLTPTGQIFVPTPVTTPLPTTGAPVVPTAPQTPGAGAQPTALPPAPTTVPPLVTATTAAPGTGGQVTYVVQAGDTLYRIAQRYNVTVSAIAAANNITNVNQLDVGQTLIIPVGGGGVVITPVPGQAGEQIHVVQAGENLFRIGLRYGCTVTELSTYNGITNPHLIYVGQQIRIPATCAG